MTQTTDGKQDRVIDIGKDQHRSGTVSILRDATNPKWFRQVLGQYPTGVCVITAMQGNGRPAGMAVGSFTSVSLDPPLVAFLPDRSSTSWPKIQATGRFCVNILGSDQEDVCRRFASKMEDKFEGLPYRPSGTGSPIVEGAIAWIDCEIQSAHEAGDHYIVVGLVKELEIESGGLPLLFFQGGYGRFWPLSLAASDPLGGISEQLRQVDIARPEMEQLAAELSSRCIATARVEDEIVITASAGQATKTSMSTLVGQRLPYIPPTGSVFAAWGTESEIDDWLYKTSWPEPRAAYKASLATVRERGYSVGLLTDAQRVFASAITRLSAEGPRKPDVDLRELIRNLSFDPPELSPAVCSDVRLISVPVFGPTGAVVLALTMFEFPKPAGSGGVVEYIDRVREAAARVTRKLGGELP